MGQICYSVMLSKCTEKIYYFLVTIFRLIEFWMCRCQAYCGYNHNGYDQFLYTVYGLRAVVPDRILMMASSCPALNDL